MSKPGLQPLSSDGPAQPSRTAATPASSSPNGPGAHASRRAGAVPAARPARLPVRKKPASADTVLRCDHCDAPTGVVDSRPSTLRGVGGIRRRRECLHCQRRFTTYEMRVDSALSDDGDGPKYNLVAVTVYEAGRIMALARALANEMEAVLQGGGE